jgi:YggT family protein
VSLIAYLLSGLISLYLVILTARVIISFIPLLARDWEPKGIVLVVAEVVYTLTDPPIKLLRKVIPPLRLGSIQIDLAFMVLWFALLILQRYLPALLG